jgi:hypothetical protein
VLLAPKWVGGAADAFQGSVLGVRLAARPRGARAVALAYPGHMGEHGKDVTVHEQTATFVLSADAPRVSITMPVEWMLTGFHRALDRLRRAAGETSAETARDVSIALFEVSSWLDSLNDRFPQLKGSPHVRALLFARNRTHHQFAEPVEIASS